MLLLSRYSARNTHVWRWNRGSTHMEVYSMDSGTAPMPISLRNYRPGTRGMGLGSAEGFLLPAASPRNKLANSSTKISVQTSLGSKIMEMPSVVSCDERL